MRFLAHTQKLGAMLPLRGLSLIARSIPGRPSAIRLKARDFARRGLGSTSNNDKPPLSRPSESEEKKTKPTFSDMMARHGPVFIVYWGSMWALGGLSMYALIQQNGPETAIQIANKVGLGSVLPLDTMDPKIGNMALAVALNEGLELVRFPFVIATTPPLTRLVERLSGRSMNRKPGKFGTLLKEHGIFFLGYWTLAWAATGGATYAGVSMFGSEAAFDLLRMVHLDQFVSLDTIDPKLGNIAVAVLINEALEPLRLPLVIATILPLKRALGMAPKA